MLPSTTLDGVIAENTSAAFRGREQNRGIRLPRQDQQPVQPGDNPNRRNANRRTVRPKVRNQVTPISEEGSLRWVEPLENPVPVNDLVMTFQNISVPAGYIELRSTLPADIAEPFVDTYLAVGKRLGVTKTDTERIGSQLKAQSYYKAARQLYSTMDEHEKVVNQPLKSVFYDSAPIPKHMAAALSMIGHIDTKLGKVNVRNPTLLFKRWIAMGLQADGTVETHMISGPDGEAQTFVWNDPDSLDYIQRVAREKIEVLTDQTFEINDDTGNSHTVSFPKLRSQPLDRYHDMLRPNVPDQADISALISLLQMTSDDWKHQRIKRVANVNDALGKLGLHYPNQDLYGEDALKEAFHNASLVYTTKARPYLEALMYMTTPPQGGTGYAAQLVSETDDKSQVSATWQMPISDSDARLGFTFTPCQSFVVSPHILAYSHKSRKHVAAALAHADGKSIVQ